MNKQSDIDASIYFEEKVDSLRNELINLGTFNPGIKEIGKNLTENFELFTYYKGDRMYINTNKLNPDSKILNNIKKVTSFEFKDENTNPTTKKKINKLYDISDKIRNLRKLLWEERIKLIYKKGITWQIYQYIKSLWTTFRQ